MFNIAIILGAGNGTRMEMEKSKLLLEIGGKTVIERTVSVFEECPEIDEIIVVCRECDVEEFSRLLPDDNISFVIGGETRQESVANAVNVIENCDFVVIHDGARPFVTEDVIVNTLEKAQFTKAAATGVMVKDTIKVVDSELNIVDTPDRSTLVSIQTPQIFDFKTYVNALEKAQAENKSYTDDCQLVENLGLNVSAVLGDYNNIKITTKSDIALAENILNHRGNEA